MLSVPLVVGTLRSGVTAAHALLVAFWFVGYFAFFATATWLHARRQARHRAPMLVYALLAGVSGLALAWWRADLLGWIWIYLPLALTSLWYSARRADRALVNDGLTILAACLVGLVSYQVGSHRAPDLTDPGWVTMLWSWAAILCYFFGTSLAVKTVIRERTNRAFHRASVGYHAAVTLGWVVVAALKLAGPGWPAWAVAGFFAVMTVRAWAIAGRRLRPRSVGLGELAASAVILGLTLAW